MHKYNEHNVHVVWIKLALEKVFLWCRTYFTRSYRGGAYLKRVERLALHFDVLQVDHAARELELVRVQVLEEHPQGAVEHLGCGTRPQHARARRVSTSPHI